MNALKKSVKHLSEKEQQQKCSYSEVSIFSVIPFSDTSTHFLTPSLLFSRISVNLCCILSLLSILSILSFVSSIHTHNIFRSSFFFLFVVFCDSFEFAFLLLFHINSRCHSVSSNELTHTHRAMISIEFVSSHPSLGSHSSSENICFSNCL